MTDNKLVSGGLLFTAVSIFTYSYHMFNKNKFKPNIKSIEENIIGEILDKQSDNNTKTPSNTPQPEQDNEIQLNKTSIDIYNEDDSPLQNLQNLEINNIVEEIQEKFTKKDSNTGSISSFLELFNTGSQTDTEELEFLNVNSNIYGELPKPSLLFKSLSCDNINYDEESDVEFSYCSEGEQSKKKKNKKGKKRNINRRKIK